LSYVDTILRWIILQIEVIYFSVFKFLFIYLCDRVQKHIEREYVLGSKILVKYLDKEKGNTIGKK